MNLQERIAVAIEREIRAWDGIESQEDLQQCATRMAENAAHKVLRAIKKYNSETEKENERKRKELAILEHSAARRILRPNRRREKT